EGERYPDQRDAAAVALQLGGQLGVGGGRQGVAEPPGDGHDQHHRRGLAGDAHVAPAHCTTRVKGAVMRRPLSWIWTNMLQRPRSGSSTPTCSTPGVAELPETAPPTLAEQALAPGAQTWVWKYVRLCSWKKMA